MSVRTVHVFLAVSLYAGLAPQAKARPAQTPGRAAPRVPIGSIAVHRGGEEVPVTLLAERLELPLEELDLTRDPVLTFEGRPITQEDLRRRVCLLAGSSEIDQFVTYILATRIREKLAAEGFDLSRSEVSDAEVQEKFEEQKKMVTQMTGMKPEEWEKQIRETLGFDRYVEFQKVQMGFEKLLMPDADPEFMKIQAEKFAEMKPVWDRQYAEYQRLMEEEKRKAAAEGREPERLPAPEMPVPDADLSFVPPVTWELLGEQLAKVLQDTYARGQKLHPMLRGGVAMTLKKNLLAGSTVAMYDELPAQQQAGVLLKVDDQVVKTEEIYALIRPRVTDGIARLALHEYLKLLAVDRALEEDGHLPTPEQAAERYAAMEKLYENSLIPLQQAVLLRGFQNLMHYKQYFRRKAAFAEMLKEDLSEQELRDHFDRGGRLFFEHGTVDGEVLFLPGETRAEAETAMDAARARLEAGEPMKNLLHDVGKFPKGQDSSDGSFRGLVRNKLRQLLEESEYTTFVTGYSLADDIFYRAQEGDLVGPLYRDFPARLSGSVLIQVGRYFATNNRRTFEESRDSVKEDLADLRFPRYADEALARCRVELPLSQ